jgi:hypothetical protein
MAKPGVWIFKGKWVVLLPVSVFCFITIFKLLMALAIDWFWCIPVALLPALGAVAFVHFCVNGKPSSWVWDSWLFALWSIKTRLYFDGYLYRAPLLWIKTKPPAHPNNF